MKHIVNYDSTNPSSHSLVELKPRCNTSYVKVQKMTPTIGEKYLWYKAKKDNITMYQDILDKRLGDVIGAPPWSSGSVLDHGSLPPVFESRRGHI